jgi:transposase
MTGREFSDWLRRQKLTGDAAASLFGVSRGTIVRWAAKRKVERYVALACRAIEAGLQP